MFLLLCRISFCQTFIIHRSVVEEGSNKAIGQTTISIFSSNKYATTDNTGEFSLVFSVTDIGKKIF